MINKILILIYCNIIKDGKEMSLTANKAIELLEKRIHEGEQLISSLKLSKETHDYWEIVTKVALENIFGAKSSHIKDVIDVGKYGAFPVNIDWEKKLSDDFNKQLNKLHALVEVKRMEFDLNIENEHSDKNIAYNDKIFIVHGHDNLPKVEVAKLLQVFKLNEIILHEMPNVGKTIIEKFEKNSEVGFAIIILSSDDIGRSKKEDDSKLKNRARQNVIFELGFFIGKLGRQRVCVLYHEGVEKPSDFDGMMYVLYDEAGAWRYKLAKELKEAGYNIDMNRI